MECGGAAGLRRREDEEREINFACCNTPGLFRAKNAFMLFSEMSRATNIIHIRLVVVYQPSMNADWFSLE